MDCGTFHISNCAFGRLAVVVDRDWDYMEIPENQDLGIIKTLKKSNTILANWKYW